MRRALIASSLLLVAACSAGGTPGFATADTVTSFAKPGTVMTTTTIKGQVTAATHLAPNLSVAVMTISATVVCVKVQGGAYAIALPPQPDREDKNKDKPTYLYHESWDMVLFNDNNNNGKYEPYLQGAKAKEADYPIQTFEHYRLGYKGYSSTVKSFIFLPFNAFEQGWLVIGQRGGQAKQYHQDFTQPFSLTQASFV